MILNVYAPAPGLLHLETYEPCRTRSMNIDGAPSAHSGHSAWASDVVAGRHDVVVVHVLGEGPFAIGTLRYPLREHQSFRNVHKVVTNLGASSILEKSGPSYSCIFHLFNPYSGDPISAL